MGFFTKTKDEELRQKARERALKGIKEIQYSQRYQSRMSERIEQKQSTSKTPVREEKVKKKSFLERFREKRQAKLQRREEEKARKAHEKKEKAIYKKLNAVPLQFRTSRPAQFPAGPLPIPVDSHEYFASELGKAFDNQYANHPVKEKTSQVSSDKIEFVSSSTSEPIEFVSPPASEPVTFMREPKVEKPQQPITTPASYDAQVTPKPVAKPEKKKPRRFGRSLLDKVKNVGLFSRDRSAKTSKPSLTYVAGGSDVSQAYLTSAKNLSKVQRTAQRMKDGLEGMLTTLKGRVEILEDMDEETPGLDKAREELGKAYELKAKMDSVYQTIERKVEEEQAFAKDAVSVYSEKKARKLRKRIKEQDLDNQSRSYKGLFRSLEKGNDAMRQLYTQIPNTVASAREQVLMYRNDKVDQINSRPLLAMQNEKNGDNFVLDEGFTGLDQEIVFGVKKYQQDMRKMIAGLNDHTKRRDAFVSEFKKKRKDPKAYAASAA